MGNEYRHTSVLLKEVIEYLNPRSECSYLDGTAGGGGYAEAILKKSSPSGKVVALDVDDAAIAASSLRLDHFGERAKVVKLSYSEVKVISGFFQSGIDGAVLDLGISSHQIDTAERGFSFQSESPLDMRMDRSKGMTAADIVNGYNADDLEEIFRELGEERFARRMARSVVDSRKKKKIETTAELAEICRRVCPWMRGKIHPATRVFQALRIEVNHELDNLKEFLEKIPGLLNKNGRLVVVSYHSLEDRLVKVRFRELAKGGGYKILTAKPVTPSEEEIRENIRSRSAKLRALERI